MAAKAKQATGSVLTPAQVAQAAFEAVNAHDPDALVANSAEDCVDDFVAVGVFRGKGEIRAFFAELFAAVPDLVLTVDRIVADGESAVVQWHGGGTFSGGPFQGIVATGKRIELQGVDFMEVSDGLLRRNTIYYDGAAFARQVGLLPPKGSRAEQAMTAAFNAKTKLLGRRRGA